MRSQVDWTVIAVVLVLLVLASGYAPFSLSSIVLGGVGIWVLYGAVRDATRGTSLSSGRTTYWRGQRIDFEAPRRGGPNLSGLWPRVVFGLLLLFVAVPWFLPYQFQVPAIIAVTVLTGAYFLWTGWRTWSYGDTEGPGVKYWRGQRIEPGRRGFSLPPLKRAGPALIPLLLGALILAGVVGMALRLAGV